MGRVEQQWAQYLSWKGKPQVGLKLKPRLCLDSCHLSFIMSLNSRQMSYRPNFLSKVRFVVNKYIPEFQLELPQYFVQFISVFHHGFKLKRMSAHRLSYVYYVRMIS